MDLGPSDNPTPDYDALLSRASSITGTPVKKRQPDDTRVKSILDRMRGGESGQESGGNTTATNPDSGAIGQFQVMPSNVPAWTRLHYGQSLTPEQFKDNPKAQQAVFNGQMGSYIKKALPLAGGDEDKAIRMAAAAWYGPGEKAFRLYDNPKPQTYNGKTYPSFREYTTNVLNKSKSSQPFDYAGLLKRADEITGDQTDYQGLIKRANDITGPPATAPSPTFASPILPTPTAQPVVNTPSLAGDTPPVESLMPTTQPQTQSVSPSQPTPYAPPSDNLITQPVTNQATTPQYSDADFSAWAKSKGVPKTAMSRAAFEAELKTVQNSQPAPAQTPNVNAPQALQANAQARPQGANPQISTPPVTNVQQPTRYGTSEPQIVDTQDAFTPEEQAKIAAQQPTTVPAIATVNVNPNASDEDKARSAANQVLVGRSTPTGPITPQDIDNWINLAKSRLPQDPHALFVGDRSSNTYSIFPNMLDQIQEMKKKSPEQLEDERKNRYLDQVAPKLSDDELRQQAIDAVAADKRGQSTLASQSGQAPPVIRPTEDEIQARMKELKALQPTDEQRDEMWQAAKDFSGPDWKLPKALFSGIGFGVGGQVLHLAAGALRPFASIGIPDGYEAVSRWGTVAKLADRLQSDARTGEAPSTGNTVTKTIGAGLYGLAPISIAGKAYEAAKLPGAAMGLFATLGGLEKAGEGGTGKEIATATRQGAEQGAAFMLGEIPTSPLAKGLTVFAGTMGVNALEGKPLDENVQSSLSNAAFAIHGALGDKSLGNSYRIWENDEPNDIYIGKDRKVEALESDPKRPITGGEVVLDPQNPVYKSANDVTNAPKQTETLKPIESNETNTEVPSQPASLDAKPLAQNQPTETQTSEPVTETTQQPSGTSTAQPNAAAPETRTVTHPNPDIDGREIVGQTADGKVIVPNENNKGGVSIVTDRGEPEKGTEAAPQEPSPEIKPELHAAYTKAFELPLIDRTRPSNRAKLARAVDVTYETESGKTITKKMTADARQKQIENKGKVLQKLLDCIHG